MYSYFNEPPQTARNTCGQAAVAAVLDFHEVDMLGTERTQRDGARGNLHWRNADAINAVSLSHPPNILWGILGTGPGRIVDALSYWGLSAKALKPGPKLGREELWGTVENYAKAGLPVVTIINRSKLVPRHEPSSFGNRIKNRLPMAHWAIVHGTDDSFAYVANVRQAGPQELIRVPKELYRQAMDEPWMSLLGYRYCAIFAAP